jgi:hypothetical protein
MGVTVTHPLPPLKEGRVERRIAVFGNTGSHFSIFSLDKNHPFSDTARLAGALPS